MSRSKEIGFVPGLGLVKTVGTGKTASTSFEPRLRNRVSVSRNNGKVRAALAPMEVVIRLAEEAQAVAETLTPAPFQEPSQTEKILATVAIVLAVYTTLMTIGVSIYNAYQRTEQNKDMKLIKERLEVSGELLPSAAEKAAAQVKRKPGAQAKGDPSSGNRDQRRFKAKSEKKQKRKNKKTEPKDEK